MIAGTDAVAVGADQGHPFGAVTPGQPRRQFGGGGGFADPGGADQRGHAGLLQVTGGRHGEAPLQLTLQPVVGLFLALRLRRQPGQQGVAERRAEPGAPQTSAQRLTRPVVVAGRRTAGQLFAHVAHFAQQLFGEIGAGGGTVGGTLLHRRPTGAVRHHLFRRRVAGRVALGQGEYLHALVGGPVGQDQRVVAQRRAHPAHGFPVVAADKALHAHDGILCFLRF